MARGRWVLADRYWQDTWLDFRLNFPNEPIDHWLLWKLLLRWAPQPHLSLLITVPVEESLRRSRQKQEPFPTPAEQLQARAEQYQRWSRDTHWIALSGLEPPEFLEQTIWESLPISAT